MSKSFIRFVSSVLIPLALALPLQAQAGMLGTAQAVSAAQAQAARDTLRGFVARAAAAGKLESFGVTAQAARERVDALTDSEAAALAAQLESLPAGADPAALWMLLVLVFLFYMLIWAPAHAAETKEPGKKK